MIVAPRTYAEAEEGDQSDGMAAEFPAQIAVSGLRVRHVEVVVLLCECASCLLDTPNDHLA